MIGPHSLIGAALAMRFVKAHTEQGPRLGVVRPDGVAELARN